AGARATSPTQPAMIVPPVSVALSRNTQILATARNQFDTAIYVRPSTIPPTSISLKGPETWRGEIKQSQSTPGQASFTVVAPPGLRKPVLLTGSVKFTDGKTYAEGYQAVGYPGLTPTNYYTWATLRVIPVEVTTAPDLKIAYIPGTGDDTPAALEQLGVTPHILTAAEITPDSLKSFDAVILGVRAYEHREIASDNAALNAYAAAGGVVLVQYNTGKLPDGTGPYPLNLGDSEKVVEENAPVALLEPANPLLTWPNKITSADFNGWVEERGHGFMGTWDPHYIALTETHDQDQKPQRGGLLVARIGRGAWIYVAYALYRQFPEGVPGSYRILANLISAGKNPGLK
ncbi:MAG TPA: hypothetical protein VJU82_09745, partial [Acidobacteriaceae bacterium]|nr:hypothetical protein [Acidobacteriaceae bacterium]